MRSGSFPFTAKAYWAEPRSTSRFQASRAGRLADGSETIDSPLTRGLTPAGSQRQSWPAVLEPTTYLPSAVHVGPESQPSPVGSDSAAFSLPVCISQTLTALR